ncbi:MAG: ABC transporter ATP-binding protein [Acidobacteriota bacterium]|nr:ABC transporter ATP-binding protein [Acidobacteriota bacterium]
MAEAVVEIAGLTKTYRSGLRRRTVHAVKDLALTVPRGSVVAFVGPNGAGKTTTIHTLLGFLKPDRGSVRIFGMPPGPAVLRKIGYQSEIFNTYPFYKPGEVLRFYGRMSHMSREALDTAIPPLLARMGLEGAAGRSVSTFSKGMTQRLGLAQALLHGPELLILDEPTSGLDPEGRRLVLDIIREEKARGRTVFLSSHILADVERTCDEVVMVRHGEVAFAEKIAAAPAGSGVWEIEVIGWPLADPAMLAGHTFTVERDTDGSATLVCEAAARKALLHALTSLPCDVVTVQPRRGTTLEEKYLEHLGRA